MRRTAGGALESYSSWGVMPLWMAAQRTPLGKARYSVEQLNHHPLGVPAVAIAALFLAVRYLLRFPLAAEEAVADQGCGAKKTGDLDRPPHAGPLRNQPRHRSRRARLELDRARRWTRARGRRPERRVLLCVLPLRVRSAFPVLGCAKADCACGRVRRISFAGQMSNFAWANELMADDEQARSVVLAGMNGAFAPSLCSCVIGEALISMSLRSWQWPATRSTPGCAPPLSSSLFNFCPFSRPLTPARSANAVPSRLLPRLGRATLHERLVPNGRVLSAHGRLYVRDEVVADQGSKTAAGAADRGG